MTNQSVQQALRTAIQGLSDRLDLKTYAKTDDVRHKDDFRVVVVKDGETIGDLCMVDRAWFTNKRIDKEARDERDAFVARTIAGIKIRRKVSK